MWTYFSHESYSNFGCTGNCNACMIHMADAYISIIEKIILCFKGGNTMGLESVLSLPHPDAIRFLAKTGHCFRLNSASNVESGLLVRLVKMLTNRWILDAHHCTPECLALAYTEPHLLDI